MPNKAAAPSSSSSSSSTATGPPASEPRDHEPSTFSDGLPLPKLLVFDLDYTLWPFWVDTHVDPPFKALPTSHAAHGRTVKDARGASLSFYRDVPGVLRACRERGLLVGAASRTHTPDLARDLLGLLQVQGDEKKAARHYFDAMQIYPGNKVSHMQKLSKQLGVGFEEMLFFDDEERNRNVERELGVCFWLVRDGVSRAEVDRGVEKWRKARGVGAGAKKGKEANGAKKGVDVSLVDE